MAIVIQARFMLWMRHYEYPVTSYIPVPCTSSPELNSSIVVTDSSRPSDLAQFRIMSAHCSAVCQSIRQLLWLLSSQRALPATRSVRDGLSSKTSSSCSQYTLKQKARYTLRSKIAQKCQPCFLGQAPCRSGSNSYCARVLFDHLSLPLGKQAVHQVSSRSKLDQTCMYALLMAWLTKRGMSTDGSVVNL